MIDRNDSLELTSCVAEIVSAYVSNNTMNSEELPSFVQLVHRSLSALSSGQAFLLSGRSDPVVPIEDSIHSDYIICLEDDGN